ncbi:hypothetical protein Ancab_020910 [Ancistrocladus abbreviatus]
MTITQYILLKLNEFVLLLNNYAYDGQAADDGSAKDLLSYVLMKLKEWFFAVWHFIEYLAGKIEEIFPPETRSKTLHRWLAVALPCLIGGLVLLLCFCCCKKCCCRGGRRSVRMMRAPGREGVVIPRNVFARNPMLYFQNLRAGRPIEEIF